MNAIAHLGEFGIFVGKFMLANLRRRPPIAASIYEAYRIGVRSLPILLIIATFVGTNLSLQGYAAFKPLGGDQLLGMFVALAGLRELAPLMVAAMVAAKAGTEMASQIAVMRIQEQIDALEVMSINPHWYLITPRLIGILIVLPALTLIAIFVLMCSAYLVAVFQLGLSGHVFLETARQATHLSDFAFCWTKAFCFGTIICLISCFYGFNSRPGPAGVGQATNAAVVMSAVVCAIINYFLSELFYL